VKKKRKAYSDEKLSGKARQKRSRACDKGKKRTVWGREEKGIKGEGDRRRGDLKLKKEERVPNRRGHLIEGVELKKKGNWGTNKES